MLHTVVVAPTERYLSEAYLSTMAKRSSALHTTGATWLLKVLHANYLEDKSTIVERELFEHEAKVYVQLNVVCGLTKLLKAIEFTL